MASWAMTQLATHGFELGICRPCLCYRTRSGPDRPRGGPVREVFSVRQNAGWAVVFAASAIDARGAGSGGVWLGWWVGLGVGWLRRRRWSGRCWPRPWSSFAPADRFPPGPSHASSCRCAGWIALHGPLSRSVVFRLSPRGAVSRFGGWRLGPGEKGTRVTPGR